MVNEGILTWDTLSASRHLLPPNKNGEWIMSVVGLSLFPHLNGIIYSVVVHGVGPHHAEHVVSVVPHSIKPQHLSVQVNELLQFVECDRCDVGMLGLLAGHGVRV